MALASFRVLDFKFYGLCEACYAILKFGMACFHVIVATILITLAQFSFTMKKITFQLTQLSKPK